MFGWACLRFDVARVLHFRSRVTIEFILSPKRDLIAAKMVPWLALSRGDASPRVINVDGHPAYASAIWDLKQPGELSRRCRCRNSPYMNNIIDQDHRFKKSASLPASVFGRLN